MSGSDVAPLPSSAPADAEMPGDTLATGARAAAGGKLAAAEPADARRRHTALLLIGVSAAIFLALVPFARAQLPAVPAFIPIYQSALVVNDLITAYLLFGQYAVFGKRGLLYLGCAYLFTAVMAAIHALSFPGLFAPHGVLGGDAQTTAWLYMFWHGGFPLLVIWHALSRGEDQSADAPRRQSAAGPITASAVAVAIGAWCATYLAATPGTLPPIMNGNRYTDTMVVVVGAVWLASVVAAWLLWRRRPHTVLDLWLLVVMCAWVFDIGLSAVFNAGRFDLGFYAGRSYGLLAASVVLAGLLYDHGSLYRRVAGMHDRAEKRLRLLHAIDQAVLAGESPEAIGSAVVQPLRELLDVPRVVLNRFDLGTGHAEWIAAAGRRRSHVGPGVRYPLVFMGDVEALRRGELQLVDVGRLPAGAERDALLASGVTLYMVVPMIAGGELIGALSFGGQSADFPPQQIAVAREVAAQIAIAKWQARLLARVRGHADELERRVRERTAQLDVSNRELEAFTYSVSHDLRAPLRAVDGYARMLEEDYAAALDEEGRRLLGVVRDSSRRMGMLIDDLLAFARLGRQVPAKHPLDMTALAREVAAEVGGAVEVAALPGAEADRALLKQVWLNLIGNARKYSSKRADPRIEVGGREEAAERVYWVRDNGAGFDMRYAAKLFRVFQRLHGQDEFPGTGVGLAIVERVVTRHGGRVWAEGQPEAGACFYFSLPA